MDSNRKYLESFGWWGGLRNTFAAVCLNLDDKKFNQMQIIVSEITPRNDDNDEEHISKPAYPRIVLYKKRALGKAYVITVDGSKPRVLNLRSTSNKRSVDSRLQTITGYHKFQNNQASVLKSPGHLADRNILLMQLAQLLCLVTPTWINCFYSSWLYLLCIAKYINSLKFLTQLNYSCV